MFQAVKIVASCPGGTWHQCEDFMGLLRLGVELEGTK